MAPPPASPLPLGNRGGATCQFHWRSKTLGAAANFSAFKERHFSTPRCTRATTPFQNSAPGVRYPLQNPPPTVRTLHPWTCQVSSSQSVTAGGAPPLLPQERVVSGGLALTYLEGNSWLVEVDGVRFLVDPIIEGPLDFGIPWLYTAYKKELRNLSVKDVFQLADCLLITQSLDDHCHLNTLRPLSSLRPDLPVVATPNAEPLLSPLFRQVTYLEPGESSQVSSEDGGRSVSVTATTGPVLGPPWQRPENGYILRSSSPGGLSVYLEPHCGFDEEELKNKEKVDVVISPVVKQELPAFTLVYGQEDAVRLTAALRARFVVPMANGDLDASGILSALVQTIGTLQTFENLLSKTCPETQLREPIPGQPLLFTPEK